MDTTIRNLDEDVYRRAKARAALEGKTIGQTVNEALRAYLARPTNLGPPMSLLDLAPVDIGEGSENLSQEIDAIVYGI